jgi:hypothetical protein
MSVNPTLWPTDVGTTFKTCCGGGGIRTPGTREGYNGFRDRPIQPLWHPSVVSDPKSRCG